MFPTIDIGAFQFTSYFLCMAGAQVAGICTVLQLARKERLPELRVLLLISLALLVGHIGSSALHYLVWLRHYADRPWRVSLFSGGAFMGGPLVAFPFLFWLSHRLRLPIWKTGDIIVPGVALGHAIGKIGCFAAGCCYGCATTLPVGVFFPDRPLGGVAVHPTQLYETATSFLLFLGLIWLWRRRSFDGQVLLTFFLSYAVIRFGIECFRGDSKRGYHLDGLLSTGQVVSICMFSLATFALLLRRRYLRARGITLSLVADAPKADGERTPAVFAICAWFTCAFLIIAFHGPLLLRDLSGLPFDFEHGHGLWNSLSLLALTATCCLMLLQLRWRFRIWHVLPLAALLVAYPLHQLLQGAQWGLVLLALLTLAWWAER
jgi:phosphatidylglycerol:prolipoprotein diacylglycerol transferase